MLRVLESCPVVRCGRLHGLGVTVRTVYCVLSFL